MAITYLEFIDTTIKIGLGALISAVASFNTWCNSLRSLHPTFSRPNKDSIAPPLPFGILPAIN